MTIRRKTDVLESFSLAYRAAMSTKHVRNAADLARFQCGLNECGGCGYPRTLDGLDVARSWGTKPFASIQQRIKFSRCGAKEARLTVLSPPSPR
jgi:hypothetical protein